MRYKKDQELLRTLLKTTPIEDWLPTVRLSVAYGQWRRRERLKPRRTGRSRIQHQNTRPRLRTS